MTAKALETAREEFDKIIEANEDGYDFVIAVNDPPEDTDVEEWPNDAYRLIDSTLDVLMQQEEPADVVAIVVHGEDDAKVLQGELTLGGENYMYSVGDSGFDDASDLDALAVSLFGGEDGMSGFAQYL